MLTKLSPFMVLENHRCDHKVYTIEAIFINILKLVYKNPKATFQSMTFNSVLHFYLIISLYGLGKSVVFISYALLKQFSSNFTYLFLKG